MRGEHPVSCPQYIVPRGWQAPTHPAAVERLSCSRARVPSLPFRRGCSRRLDERQKHHHLVVGITMVMIENRGDESAA